MTRKMTSLLIAVGLVLSLSIYFWNYNRHTSDMTELVNNVSSTQKAVMTINQSVDQIVARIDHADQPLLVTTQQAAAEHHKRQPVD